MYAYRANIEGKQEKREKKREREKERRRKFVNLAYLASADLIFNILVRRLETGILFFKFNYRNSFV